MNARTANDNSRFYLAMAFVATITALLVWAMVTHQSGDFYWPLIVACVGFLIGRVTG